MEEIIRLKNLNKTFKEDGNAVTILSDINLSVYEQEYIAITGPSGSGKSTLLGIMAGLESATSGEVIVNGFNILKAKEDELAEFRNKNIGIIFQNFNLIQSLSARDNIEVPLYFSKNKVNASKISKELLELVGMKDKANRLPKQLSGGEQQRIAIARAMALQPKIIFADEPTGALDSKNGENIMNIFENLKSVYKTTIIMVTHDKTIAAKADKIINIKDGLLTKVNEVEHV